MKTFAIALLGSFTAAKIMSKLDYDYMRYVSEFNKMYDTVEEFNTRQALFADVDEFIRNANKENGPYRAGHNKFSDWTKEEKDGLLGLKNVTKPEIPDEETEEVDASGLPSSWDWRDQGVVTDVKDQGNCGSCWAFSAVEAVESAYAISGGDLTVMSEQEIVDCTLTPVTSNMGCNGGWYFWTYDWLAGHKTMKESDYPYTSGTTGTESACAYDDSKGVTTVSSYGRTWLTQSNLDRLSKQPVNVAVAAGNNVFMNYSSGIITADEGCPHAIDHAIVAVGWGEEDGIQYYIVRNSWGTGWGEDGYVRIATGGYYGVCGINSYVFYPTV